jgi:hypothetical protein
MREIFIVAATTASIALSGCLNNIDLPACDAAEVVKTAKDIIKASPVTQMLQIRDFEHPVEAGYDSKAERRTCMATLKTQVGQERVKYTLEWHDKKANLYWLEFQD